MKTERLIAPVAVLAFSLSGCTAAENQQPTEAQSTPHDQKTTETPPKTSNGRPAEVFQVGYDDRVTTTKDSVQQDLNTTTELKAGEECVLRKGAWLLLKDNVVTYSVTSALGTECPAGAELDLSRKYLKKQDKVFRAEELAERAIIKQIERMPKTTTAPHEELPDDWVGVVNPESRPAKLTVDMDHKTFTYGDMCLPTDGYAQKLGELSDGSEVMMVTVNFGQPGYTNCPTGTLYLQ